MSARPLPGRRKINGFDGTHLAIGTKEREIIDSVRIGIERREIHQSQRMRQLRLLAMEIDRILESHGDLAAHP